MNDITASARSLARRLITLESPSEDGSEPAFGPALRAVEKLRRPLTRLSGTAGYRSLVMRALALSSAYTPWLTPLRIEPDGSIQWAGEALYSDTSDGAEEGGLALVSELVALLITFIGEGITLQLVRSAWPDASPGITGFEEKEAPR